MNAKRTVALAFALGVVIGSIAMSTAANPAPQFETLLRSDLETASDLEVIVSVIDVPAGMTLPKHHHPGEEFIYLLEGSAILWQEGKADVEASAGDALKVPLEQVHTAITGDEPMRAVVFRVHRKGEPERIPAE